MCFYFVCFLFYLAFDQYIYLIEIQKHKPYNYHHIIKYNIGRAALEQMYEETSAS